MTPTTTKRRPHAKKKRRAARTPQELSQATSRPTAIVEIQVEGLFYLYDYQLAQKPSGTRDVSQLLILYGDNGSGKTTILKLLFHLLSPEDNRGHRSFIATVPFRRIAVTLANGTTVEAYRDPAQRVGSYTLRITKHDRTVDEIRVPANDKNVVQIELADVEMQAHWARFIGELQGLNISLSYLPDDRKVLSPFASSNEPVDLIGGETAASIRYLRARYVYELEETVLERAIKSAEESLKTDALHAASMGEADTNKIYIDIIRRIARAKGTRSAPEGQEAALTRRLTELEARSRAYSSLGLMSQLNVGQVLGVFEGATKPKRQIIGEVLAPYVNGLDARLNALQDVQEVIQTFLEVISTFYLNKRVSFDLSRGLQIESSNGDPLAPAMLSSGEKQLLLLFCNTIVARRQAGIFFIDEPEISLNVKWQRKLLRALIGLTRGTQLQFVVATHSIELLSQFQAHVLALQNVRIDANRA